MKLSILRSLAVAAFAIGAYAQTPVMMRSVRVQEKYGLTETVPAARATRGASPLSWTETHYRAKFGRPTPAAEVRQEEEAASTAYRYVTPAKTSDSRNWLRALARGKYGVR